VTSASTKKPSNTPAHSKLSSTVTVPKTTVTPTCDDHYAREAEPEAEAAPEDGDALAKRQLLSAVLGLAADKITKGCECLSLKTKTVTKTTYKTDVSFTSDGLTDKHGVRGWLILSLQTSTKYYGTTTADECEPTY
jgi:hypothetical protein